MAEPAPRRGLRRDVSVVLAALAGAAATARGPTPEDSGELVLV